MGGEQLTGFDSQQGLAGSWIRLARFAFRLLYNEMAWSYDLVSWVVSLGQWRDWQRAAFPYLKGTRVLELAHGPGHTLVALVEAGFEVTGLDLSPYMGRMARRRLRRARAAARLVRGRAQSLPYADGVFDSVLATFPTEFIVDEDSIASLFRTLRPGGCLVIVPEARLTGRGLLQSIIGWLYTITGQRPVTSDESDSLTPWPNSAQKFVAAGFELQMEREKLERSEVIVVVATKPT